MTSTTTGSGALPRKVCLIVNRRAGLAGSGSWMQGVRAVLDRRFIVDVAVSTSIDHMQATIRERSQDRDTLVIIAGGDGTFNAALQADVDCPLGILPLGTANDLARALGLPDDSVGAAERIVAGRLRDWDRITVNGRSFCTVGGIGIAADVVTTMRQRRARSDVGRPFPFWPAATAYHVTAAHLIATRPLTRERIHIEATLPNGAALAARVFNSASVLVANQSTFARSLCVSPRSRPDDGAVEICIFHDTSRAGMLYTLAKLVAGRRADTVEVLSVVRARLTIDRPVLFFGDGEPLTTDRILDLTIAPRAIAIVS